MSRNIALYSVDEFDGMRKAGRLAAETLDYITPFVVPGVTTGRLDELLEEFMRDHDGIPATLGYRGYPKASCISATILFVTAFRVIKFYMMEISSILTLPPLLMVGSEIQAVCTLSAHRLSKLNV